LSAIARQPKAPPIELIASAEVAPHEGRIARELAALALVAIAAGAFGRFMYRLTGNAVPISLDDAARISSGHVLELARYVEQCSPGALLRIGSLIAASPIGVATLSGSALLIALNFRRRFPDWWE